MKNQVLYTWMLHSKGVQSDKTQSCPSKRRQLFSVWHGETSQKSWISLPPMLFLARAATSPLLQCGV